MRGGPTIRTMVFGDLYLGPLLFKEATVWCFQDVSMGLVYLQNLGNAPDKDHSSRHVDHVPYVYSRHFLKTPYKACLRQSFTTVDAYPKTERCPAG